MTNSCSTLPWLLVLSSAILVGQVGGCAAEPEAQPAAEPTPQTEDENNPWVLPGPPVPSERPPKATETAGAPGENWQDVGPVGGVRVDRTRRIVEVSGKVPIDAHDAEAPVVYLEAVACTHDTREHESLVVSTGSPSNAHAALLLIGLEPGKPGRVGWDGQAMRQDPPTGPSVTLRIRWTDPAGKTHEDAPGDWIVNARTGKHLGEEYTGDRWVFSGSRFLQRKNPETGVMQEIYDADFAGTFIGLHTFGAETIAFTRPMNPDAGNEAPEWVADAKRVPKFGTPVVIVITPADAAKPSAATPAQPPVPGSR